VRLTRAACSLSDVDSQFFPSQKNSFPWFRLKSVPLHKNVWVGMLRYQRKNEVGNLREFGLNLVSNIICAVAWKFRYWQSYENEIWQKMKRMKLYWHENDDHTNVFHYPIKCVAEQPMYHNCASLCSLCEGKVGAKAIYISLVFMNYSN